MQVLSTPSRLRIKNLSSSLLKLSQKGQSAQNAKVFGRELSTAWSHQPFQQKNQKLTTTSSRRRNLLLNENEKNAFESSSNGFASMAWLGLWGKAPEKSTTELPQEIIPMVPSDDVQATATTVPVPDTSSKLEEMTQMGYIPEPPPIVDETIILNVLGEPALKTLGLCSNWTPTGWIQTIIEVLHVDVGLEWYQAIGLFAIILRTCLLPITIRSQRMSTKMRKIGPEMTQMQEKMQDARNSGNQMDYMKATGEMQQYMKANDMSPLSFFVPFMQFPFVISAFIALRGMCNLPVESMTTGGALWFTDLTVCDPTYVLPTVASLSIFAMLYRGIDTGVSATTMKPGMKLLMYGMSAVSFPIFCYMPSGLMAYVCVTNAFSFCSAFVFSWEPVKKALKIPVLTPAELIKIKDANAKKAKFLDGLRDSYQNQKLSNELANREKLRAKQFAPGVRIKTTKKPPTKQIQ